MKLYKSESKAFGICFIIAFLSYGIGSGLIDSLISSPDFLSQVYADNRSIVIGVVLIGLLHSFVNIALPVIMLPILKPYSSTLAYGYLSAAIIATTILALGSIFLLMLIPLSHEHAKADVSLIPNLELMGILLKKGAYYCYHMGMALWSIGGLMLVALLYKSKLTPRPLSVLGVIGYLFLVIGSVMSLLEKSDAVEIISVIPGGIFEITLSIWLIIKGFRTSTKPSAISRGVVKVMSPTVVWPELSSPMLKSPALLTGFSLISMAVIAGFAYGFVYNLIYVSGDPVSSQQALLDNFELYTYGIIAWGCIIILDIMASIGIYALYKSTHKKLILFTSLLRITYTLFLILATYQLAMPLMDHNEIHNNLYYMEFFSEIWTYGLIVFGLHLIFLSRVCLQSNFTPKIISVLLCVGGISYVVVESLKSFYPTLYSLTDILESVLIIPMAISELAFSIWLIVKAIRLPHYSLTHSK